MGVGRADRVEADSGGWSTEVAGVLVVMAVAGVALFWACAVVCGSLAVATAAWSRWAPSGGNSVHLRC